MHTGALPLDGGDGFRRLPLGEVLLQFLRAGGNDGHRRAQLVGGVRRKLALPGKGSLEPVQHGIKSVGQLLNFILGGNAGDALGQVAGPNGFRGLGDLCDGADGPFGQEIRAGDGQSQVDGHQNSQQHL